MPSRFPPRSSRSPVVVSPCGIAANSSHMHTAAIRLSRQAPPPPQTKQGVLHVRQQHHRCGGHEPRRPREDPTLGVASLRGRTAATASPPSRGVSVESTPPVLLSTPQIRPGSAFWVTQHFRRFRPLFLNFPNKSRGVWIWRVCIFAENRWDGSYFGGSCLGGGRRGKLKQPGCLPPRWCRLGWLVRPPLEPGWTCARTPSVRPSRRSCDGG